MYQAVIFPDTRTQLVSRIYLRRPCPDCGRLAKRRSAGVRQLRHLGINYPVVLEVHYSKHYCPACGKYFNAPMEDLAEAGSLFSNVVKERALASVFIDQLPLQKVVERMLRDFNVHIPLSTLESWVVQAGEKNQSPRALRAVGGG